MELVDMTILKFWIFHQHFEFSKKEFDLDKVSEYAEAMEKKYNELRELTCPDDD